MRHISQRTQLQRPGIDLERSALQTESKKAAVLRRLKVRLRIKAPGKGPVDLFTFVRNKEHRVRGIEPALLTGYLTVLAAVSLLLLNSQGTPRDYAASATLGKEVRLFGLRDELLRRHH